MATTAMESGSVVARGISVARLAAAAGITAVVVFILCWIGTFIPFSSPTHAYISLFTLADPQSIMALIEGGLWSFLFGVLVGMVFALTYNKMRAGTPRVSEGRGETPTSEPLHRQ